MLFLSKQTQPDRDKYRELLKAVSSLSNLFSDSNVPYINYRVAENLFCKAFNADNLARSDISYDAKKDNIGIGIKTFICNKESKFEKVAEFNSLSRELKRLEGKKLAEKLADFRNERILFANRIYKIENGYYHCITRTSRKLVIYETDYRLIDKDSLKLLKSSDASFKFRDRYNSYLFNYSKSTLFQQFNRPEHNLKIPVDIIDDPYEIILRLLKLRDVSSNSEIGTAGEDYVILPLYSTKLSKEDNRVVPEKSGLNQWNAGGRARKAGELYIPVPAAIHNCFPEFFPPRNRIFTLKTPDDNILSAKLCQDGAKALMTNPNHALEEWLMRKVLMLLPNRLLTYRKLLELGIDSVIITKLSADEFKIDFAAVDSFESFKEKYLMN